MFYIIDSENKCIAVCDNCPDDNDLKSRDQFSIESQEIYNIGCTYENEEFKAAEKTNAEKLYEFLQSVSKSLSVCNSVGLQCYMISSPYPSDWVSYREKLVALSSTTEWNDSLVLPTQLDIPTGIVI